MSLLDLLPEQTASLAPGITIPLGSTPLYAGALTPELQEIAWAIQTIGSRRPFYLEYQAYYGGAHRLAFSTEGYREKFALMLRNLNANLCPAVISAFADKLAITGFEEHSGMVEGDTNAVAEDATEADEAWSLWEDANLELLADEVHDEALINGDGYIVVWPDEQNKAQFYANDATEMAVRYEVEHKDRIDLAAKLWRDGKRWRLTIYTATEIRKYRTSIDSQGDMLPTSARAFVPFQPDGDIAWPVPNPYGEVPVYHFAPGGKLGHGGISELSDVLPLQNALNKALADQVVAEEFGAYVQRWATGVEKEVRLNPETGMMEDIDNAAVLGLQRILTVADPGAKFGQFTPTDLKAYIELVNSYFSLVGKIKGIPSHYFYMVTGDFPSGEAQRVAEERLVKRAMRLQRRFGAVWARVMAFALKVNNIGDGTLSFTTKWESPEPRGTDEDVKNFAAAISAGMPMETAASMYLSMPDEKIQTMIGKKAEADRQAIADAQSAFTRAMDRGALPTGGRQSASGGNPPAKP